MAILSIAMFGTALFASTYAMWATIWPELARIADLLVNGPVATPIVSSVSASARGSLRNVRVRQVSMAPRSPQRAVA